MKKRKELSIITIVAALILSICFSIPVYATSRTTTGEVLGATRSLSGAQVLGATRNSVSGEGITVGTITDKEALASLSDLEIFARLISAYTHKTVTAKELSVLSSMDINNDEKTVVSKENPIFVTFGFPAIVKNSEVYVFHYKDGQWVIVPETVSEGQVIGEFTSFSPVAIVAKTSTLNGAVLGANRSVSPRTGDNSYMILIIIASLSGLGLMLRKKMFS